MLFGHANWILEVEWNGIRLKRIIRIENEQMPVQKYIKCSTDLDKFL